MSRHRLEPTRRLRPRYGRVAAAGLSLVVTMVALLGFIGLIPLGSAPAGDAVTVAGEAHRPAAGAGDTDGSAGTPAAGSGVSRSQVGRSSADSATGAASTTVVPPSAKDSTALPADSGTGRRVVFAQGAQRVWIVGSDGKVEATYLVSGSLTDNLAPGKYDVYSRSRWAVGIEDSGVMEYFVRFAHGKNAAIGFHSIPTKDGVPLQTEAQLGTPQSHGCIRQRLTDAQRMWDFADVGTDVVVVA